VVQGQTKEEAAQYRWGWGSVFWLGSIGIVI